MKTVTRKECSTISMVEGNEKRITVINDNGIIKEWVGFGWIEITLHPQSATKLEDIPVLID